MIVRILVRILTLLARFIANFIFKLEVRCVSNVPKNGGALIISNHVSFLDNMVIIASLPRDVGFVMAKKVYDSFFLNWLLKKMPMVPIETGKGKEYLKKFNKDCQDKINEGNLVCIFAEGQISRNGHLLEFKKGFEHIASGLNDDIPILPVHIDGLIGTPLSYDNVSNRTLKFRLKHFFKRVVVSFGVPLEKGVSAFEVRQVVKELEVSNFSERISPEMNLLKLSSKTTSKNEDLWRDSFDLSQSMKEDLYPYHSVGVSLDDEYNSIRINLACAILGKQVINFSSDDIKKGNVEKSGIEVFLSEKECESVKTFLPKLEDIMSHENVVVPMFSKENSVASFTEEGELFTLTHENFIAYYLSLKQLFGFDKESIICTDFSLDTPIGYFLKVWANLLVGSKVTNQFLKETTVLVGNAEYVNSFYEEMNGENLKLIILFDAEIKDLSSKVNKEIVYLGLKSNSSCPVIALNSPDFEGKSLEGKVIKQSGREKETYGRPLPGIATKVIDQNGMEVLPGVRGMVMVKGVFFAQKGWVDIKKEGYMTEEGFLSI